MLNVSNMMRPFKIIGNIYRSTIISSYTYIMLPIINSYTLYIQKTDILCYQRPVLPLRFWCVSVCPKNLQFWHASACAQQKRWLAEKKTA